MVKLRGCQVPIFVYLLTVAYDNGYNKKAHPPFGECALLGLV